jgi:hypothetical protein
MRAGSAMRGRSAVGEMRDRGIPTAVRPGGPRYERLRWMSRRALDRMYAMEWRVADERIAQTNHGLGAGRYTHDPYGR